MLNKGQAAQQNGSCQPGGHMIDCLAPRHRLLWSNQLFVSKGQAAEGMWGLDQQQHPVACRGRPGTRKLQRQCSGPAATRRQRAATPARLARSPLPQLTSVPVLSSANTGQISTSLVARNKTPEIWPKGHQFLQASV